MCPFSSLPPNEGPSRFSPTSVKDWQPRRKSVSNACERCRRRKIRCDGDTPCATCKRFSLQCSRTQKPKELVASEHREALESRIHQLESQLAAHVNAPMHGMEAIEETILAAAASASADFSWQDTSPPPMNIDTTFAASFDTSRMNLGEFPQGNMPIIAINQCEHVPNVASPLESPVPSFWSGTTRASSPDMPPTSVPPQFVSIPPHLFGSKPSTSPQEPHTAPSWEFMAQLQPGPKTAGRNRSHSRNTSNSSASLESDGHTMSPIPEIDDDLKTFAASAPRLPRQGVFAPSPAPGSTRSRHTDRSRTISTTPLPSQFEAETLTSEFLQHVENAPQLYGLSAGSFAQFCDTVYPNPHKASSAIRSTSISMAKFHVFLAMATGMKLRIKDSPESSNALLDACYDLAMRQTTVSTFWQEEGGIEAAQLLAIFAGIRKTTTLDHSPLQHSFTW